MLSFMREQGEGAKGKGLRAQKKAFGNPDKKKPHFIGSSNTEKGTTREGTAKRSQNEDRTQPQTCVETSEETQDQREQEPIQGIPNAKGHPKKAPQEYVTVATRQKQVRKTTILLAVLFGIAAVCLWFMIKKSTPQAATAAAAGTEDTQIENVVTRLTGVRSEMFNRMGEIVKKFYEFTNVQQVNVHELVKNPFELETLTGNEEKVFNRDAEMMRQQRLRQQTKNMQLLSIMQSDQGRCCMIDDRILYEGDSIRSFEVRKITDRFVKLGSEDLEIVLRLSE
ncbi:MAG: hypothetical protein AMJ43_09610 [Coxiella sp. DG_40]|nr:MAG: hypothetical protein AMJ43_09610 [Coxiella sp. DG_40]